MMKLGTVIPYLKKIQKLYKSRDTIFHQKFFMGNPQTSYIKKYRYRKILEALEILEFFNQVYNSGTINDVKTAQGMLKSNSSSTLTDF